MQTHNFYVLRNGVLQIAPSDQLYVTDRILTTAGEYVPVAVLLETRQAQQSSASGLSVLVDAVGMIGLLVGTAWILAECFKPPRRGRKPAEEIRSLWRIGNAIMYLTGTVGSAHIADGA